MAANPTVEKFSRIIEKVFGQKITAKKTGYDFKKSSSLFKDDYDNALRIVTSTKQAAVLTELMNMYLDLYGRYSANKDNIHFYMSDQTFLVLFEQSAKVDKETGDLFEIWDGFLTGNKISDNSNSFKKRFAELNLTIQSQINTFRNEQREKKRQSKSMLDVLRDEYARQHSYSAKNNDDLYDFDPKTSTIVKTKLEEQLNRLLGYWNKNKEEYTKNDTDDLNRYLNLFIFFTGQEAGKNVLVLFQLIKYLQDFFITKREPVKNAITGKSGVKLSGTDSHEFTLYCGMYLMLCIRLMEVGKNVKLYKSNMYGFTPEEVNYLIKPIRARGGFPYLSNVEHVISFYIKKNEDLQSLYGTVILFLDTYLLTHYQLKGVSLVNWKRTQEIQHIWKEILEFTSFIRTELSLIMRHQPFKMISESDIKLAVQAVVNDPRNLQAQQYFKIVSETELKVNPGRANLCRATLRAGDSFGSHEKFGDVSIVYLDPAEPNQIYIEFATLKPQLFVTSADYVANKFCGGKIMEIYTSTIGMVHLNNMILNAMMFLPTFIESGFAGLIHEIVLFYASEKVEELVSELNPHLGELAGWATMIVGSRSHSKPEIKGPAPHLPPANSIPVKITEVIVKEDRAAINDATRMVGDASSGKSSTAVAANFAQTEVRAEEKSLAQKWSIEDAVFGRTKRKAAQNENISKTPVNDNLLEPKINQKKIEPQHQLLEEEEQLAATGTDDFSRAKVITKDSRQAASDTKISMSGKKTGSSSSPTNIKGLASYSQRGTEDRMVSAAGKEATGIGGSGGKPIKVEYLEESNVSDAFLTGGVSYTKNYKEFIKRGGQRVDKTKVLEKTRHGRHQMEVTGSGYEYTAKLSNGTSINPDGIARADNGTGKLVFLEHKYSYIQTDNLEKSGHIVDWWKKRVQLRNQAKYVYENSDIFDHVIVVVNNYTAEAIFTEIRQHVPMYLRDYIKIVWIK